MIHIQRWTSEQQGSHHEPTNASLTLSFAECIARHGHCFGLMNQTAGPFYFQEPRGSMAITTVTFDSPSACVNQATRRFPQLRWDVTTTRMTPAMNGAIGGFKSDYQKRLSDQPSGRSRVDGPY